MHMVVHNHIKVILDGAYYGSRSGEYESSIAYNSSINTIMSCLIDNASSCDGDMWS